MWLVQCLRAGQIQWYIERLKYHFSLIYTHTLGYDSCEYLDQRQYKWMKGSHQSDEFPPQKVTVIFSGGQRPGDFLQLVCWDPH